jgi:hypothetical protein
VAEHAAQQRLQAAAPGQLSEAALREHVVQRLRARLYEPAFKVCVDVCARELPLGAGGWLCHTRLLCMVLHTARHTPHAN